MTDLLVWAADNIDLWRPAAIVVPVVDRGPFTAAFDFDLTSETAIRKVRRLR